MSFQSNETKPLIPPLARTSIRTVPSQFVLDQDKILGTSLQVHYHCYYYLRTAWTVQSA
jgi:hypothetical protein